MTAVRALISGRVQGVFFRQFAKDLASLLGLEGWARNLDSGQVEVFCQGDSLAVAKFIEECRKGPGSAKVDSMDIFKEEEQELKGFVIRN